MSKPDITTPPSGFPRTLDEAEEKQKRINAIYNLEQAWLELYGNDKEPNPTSVYFKYIGPPDESSHMEHRLMLLPVEKLDAMVSELSLAISVAVTTPKS